MHDEFNGSRQRLEQSLILGAIKEKTAGMCLVH